MAILVAIFIPIFTLGREIDKSNAYMKFGRNPVKVSTRAYRQAEANLATILARVCRTMNFELGQEIDKSNAYMKFGRNSMSNDFKAEDKVSCSRTQCSASSEARTCSPSNPSQALYH